MHRSKTSLISLCLLSFVLLNSCQNSHTNSSNLDFTGLDEFWNVSSILKQGIKPDQEDWIKLFKTPGYLVLIENEFSEEYWKKYFRLAYMPDKTDELAEELKKSHWRVQYLEHMTKVYSNKEEIESHRKYLINSNFLTQKSLELTKEYLPDNTINNENLPLICYLIFGNDARGYSPIVIDILHSIEQGEKLKYLVGHEMHHFYRNKMLMFDFPDYEHPDFDLVWVINQIHAEGIADQIDKRERYFDGGDQVSSKRAANFIKYLDNTPVLLEKLDSLFIKYRNTVAVPASVSREIRNMVPLSGHPTGYYMTDVIYKNLGKSALVDNLGNPFDFFKLYNKAASMGRVMHPNFSTETMELIDELEKKYQKEL